MEINTLVKKGKVNAFCGLSISTFLQSKETCCVQYKEYYQSILVSDYILSSSSSTEKKIMDSLKMVLLSSDVLAKKMNVLSSTEILKVELAILLLQNVDTIVLYQFDCYFMEKELAYFKKLFKKLVLKYGKTIVLLDSKLLFLVDFADRIVVKNEKKELEVFVAPNFYEERLLELLGTPKIVEFVKFVNENGKKLLPYTDMKELIKAIYREV